MTITEFIIGNKETIQSVVQIGTLLIAFYGFSVWKRQLKGSTKYQISKEIIKATYRTKNGFSHVRNAYMSGGEYPPEFQEKEPLFGDDRRKANIFAYNKRLDVLNNEFKSLEELIIEGIVILDKRLETAIIPLRKCRAELIVALQEYLYYQDGQQKSDIKRSKEIHGIIYEIGLESRYDILTKYIKEATDLLILTVKPYLSDKIMDHLLALSIKNKIKTFEIKMPDYPDNNS